MRDTSIDYLRSFVIVLVVLHHAALAYTSFSVFNENRYVDSTAPVVDGVRWSPLDVFVGFNDAFFMPLLFFVSGLFCLQALEKAGSWGFLKSRFKRLGVPFLIAAVTVIPLSYWPSHMLSNADTPFLSSFFTTDGWPSGPVWFLWVLLAYSCVAALIFKIVPALLRGLVHKPSTLIVFLVTLAAYVPVGIFVAPYAWTSLGGPFDVQASRIILYFACFMLGLVIGSKNVFSNRDWPGYWLPLLIVGFIAFQLHGWLLRNPGQISGYSIILGTAFSVSCVGISLGVLGAFRRFVNKQNPIMDSLSENAFGIYLLHYVFVVWAQFYLLGLEIPAWAKFLLVSVSSLLLSWLTSIALRKIPLIRSIL